MPKTTKKITKKTPLKVSAAKKTADFSILLKANDTEFAGKGKTLDEALAQVPETLWKNKGLLQMKGKGKNVERWLNIMEMRKLFNGTRISREIMIKRLGMFLG